ncbi:MAG: DEAD/DEAH box helicase, partial [Phycisphaerae bacterium]|nr:DEAD/DEAH box helicase [Phycisphaerae bacterium]
MPLDVVDILGAEGPIARRLGPTYEARPQQLEMAAAVDGALSGGQDLVVEAGTGVGKSFAYLLPAIRRVVEHQQRVVISTHTISLQEQLMEKDIPLLQAVCQQEFSAVLVKGRRNYVSLRRLMLASKRQDQLFHGAAERRSLHAIEDWAYETDDGK